MTTNDGRVTELCDAVMRGVVQTLTPERARALDVDLAIEIMRARVRAFLMGPEHAGTREAILCGAVSTQTALALVVAECVADLAPITPGAALQSGREFSIIPSVKEQQS